MGLTGLKLRLSGRAAFLSRGSRGESISLPFSASRGFLHSLAHGPTLHLQSQQQSNLSLTLIFILSLLHWKDLCDYLGPIWIIEDNLPILRPADSNLNSPSVPGIRTWTSLRGHYSANHRGSAMPPFFTLVPPQEYFLLHSRVLVILIWRGQ